MHWYDQYKTEYKHECWQFDDCDGDCEHCDQFQQDLADYVGSNERVWPYDYLTQDQYEEACSFANEADDLIADEEVRWWCGDMTIGGELRIPAVDPRNFESRTEYNDVLYRHLFSEAVLHHPQIPPSELWYRVFVNLLEDSESPFCAEKSILAILEELNYAENYPQAVLHTILPNELEHEIRYSSWDKDAGTRKRARRRRYYDEQIKPAKIEKYTAQQYRNDLVYHYPELYQLVYKLALNDTNAYA